MALDAILTEELARSLGVEEAEVDSQMLERIEHIAELNLGAPSILDVGNGGFITGSAFRQFVTLPQILERRRHIEVLAGL